MDHTFFNANSSSRDPKNILETLIKILNTMIGKNPTEANQQALVILRRLHDSFSELTAQQQESEYNSRTSFARSAS
ncbi:MAG: hypothetical protein A3E88_01745 [Legionellales bacterium RIFCSPHIGHO2_12_FULL_35_11]|nr:MAG: hypothetical protein A3E88_01745 [Legionellales bacterium RIFCSPHIGHO2_12_FULL_35_11]